MKTHVSKVHVCERERERERETSGEHDDESSLMMMVGELKNKDGETISLKNETERENE